MRPRPDQVGGPVADLKGRVIGITVARADRTRSFVMPAAAVEKLLQSEPSDPALARVRQPDQEAELPVRRMAAPGGGERLRQHLSEMQRLMDFMREEMENLER
jgi:hypothetical protein